MYMYSNMRIGAPRTMCCTRNRARAAAEAAKARYAWLEMLALASLLRWSEAGEAENVRLRLRAVTERLAASAEEVAQVVGEGVLVLA